MTDEEAIKFLQRKLDEVKNKDFDGLPRPYNLDFNDPNSSYHIAMKNIKDQISEEA